MSSLWYLCLAVPILPELPDISEASAARDIKWSVEFR